MRTRARAALRPATNRSLPRIGGWPGVRKTTSSSIRPSSRDGSPAAVALIHSAMRSRIACSSACIGKRLLQVPVYLESWSPGRGPFEVQLYRPRSSKGPRPGAASPLHLLEEVFAAEEPVGDLVGLPLRPHRRGVRRQVARRRDQHVRPAGVPRSGPYCRKAASTAWIV